MHQAAGCHTCLQHLSSRTFRAHRLTYVSALLLRWPGLSVCLPACLHVSLCAGELVPKAYHGVLHPVLVTAVVANAGLALQGKLLGISYAAAQKAYLAKVRSTL